MALIVEDEIGDVPPEVANAEEVILMIQHFEADTLANAAATSNDGWFDLDPNGEVGNSFRLVNGKYNPTLEIVAGVWQRWRTIYGSWDREQLDLSMDTNGVCEMNLLAKDGIYISDYPRPLTFYPISTAGRADIMVRCSATGQFTATDFENQSLFTLNVVAPNGEIDVSTPPTSGWPFPTPSYISDLTNRNPTPGCICTTRLNQLFLNSRSYDPTNYLHTVAQGSIVERELRGINNHPYHRKYMKPKTSRCCILYLLQLVPHSASLLFIIPPHSIRTRISFPNY